MKLKIGVSLVTLAAGAVAAVTCSSRSKGNNSEEKPGCPVPLAMCTMNFAPVKCEVEVKGKPKLQAGGSNACTAFNNMQNAACELWKAPLSADATKAIKCVPSDE